MYISIPTTHNLSKKILLAGLLLTFLLSQLAPSVHALSADQKKVFDKEVHYFNTEAGTACAEDSTLVGSNNKEKIWNYFVGKGLSPVQTAGIYGNMMRESSGDPQNIQDPGGRSRNPEDAGGAGWGLIQWTPGTKIIGMAQQAGIKEPIYTLTAQLDLVWAHFRNNPVVTQPFDLEHFKRITDLQEAVAYFEEKIEGARVVALAERLAFAREGLQLYGSGTGGGASPSGDGCEGTVSSSSVVRVAKREYQENKGIQEYGGDIMKYTDGNAEAWCADFVSWVYKDAGVAFKDGSSGGWRHAGVLELQSWFKSNHIYFEVGEQKPKQGDVAFYIGAQTPDGGSTQHVNIVIEVNGNKMTTIGGNESNQVMRGTRTIELGSSGLAGFGRIK